MLNLNCTLIANLLVLAEMPEIEKLRLAALAAAEDWTETELKDAIAKEEWQWQQTQTNEL